MTTSHTAADKKPMTPAEVGFLVKICRESMEWTQETRRGRGLIEIITDDKMKTKLRFCGTISNILRLHPSKEQ